MHKLAGSLYVLETEKLYDSLEENLGGKFVRKFQEYSYFIYYLCVSVGAYALLLSYWVSYLAVYLQGVSKNTTEIHPQFKIVNSN